MDQDSSGNGQEAREDAQASEENGNLAGRPAEEEPPPDTRAESDSDADSPDRSTTPDEQGAQEKDFDEGEVGSWSRGRDDREVQRGREFDMFDVRLDRVSRYVHSDIEVHGDGNTTAGRDVVQTFFDSRPPDARAGALAAEWVESAMATYVPAPSRDHIEEVLRELGVVLLTGPDGTGRFRTACHVLARLFDPGKVVELDLDGSLNAVTDQDWLLRKGHGHVLELAGTQLVNRQKLAAIGDRARKVGSRVIVVGQPDRVVDPALLPYALRHDNPPPVEVLRSHLVDRLRTEPCVGACVSAWGQCTKACIGPFVQQSLDDPDVAKYLACDPVARDVADLARRLIDVHHRGGGPGEAIQLLYSQLRAVAADVLRGLTHSPGKPSQNRQILRTLAFRVAYAAFGETPLRIVFAATEALYQALSAAIRPNQPPLATQPLDGRVRQLLDGRMIADDGRDGNDGNDADGGDGRPRLIDPRLANAMLDVLWNDYSEFRTPLLEWTLVLGTHEREDVRRRAASIGALFGRWDVPQVYRALIAPWAASPGWRTRHTAAYTMAILAVEPSLTSWVRRQLADWSDAVRTTMNDTAARAYAEIPDNPFTEDLLPNLRRIAAKPELTASFAVPKAVSTLCEQQPQGLPVILATLAHWAEQPIRGLQVQAARSLLFLADEPAEHPHSHWPRVLLQAGDDPATWDNLKALWCFALSEATTNVAAWRRLLEWLRAADAHDDQADVTARFANELLKESPLHNRARFYVWQWRKANPDLTILRRLLPRDED